MAIGTEYFVETKIGKVKVIPNNGTTAYISLGESINTPEGFQIEVNRVKYTGSLRLQLENGQWGVAKGNGDPHGYHALLLNSRYDGRKFIEPSDAAKSKIKAVVIPAIQAFFDEHPEALAAAVIQDRREKIEQQLTEVRKIKQEFEQSLKELQRLWIEDGESEAMIRLRMQSLAVKL
jgi:hypothetical protein